MGRRYVRDRDGRFASVGATARGGTLAARRSLTRSQRKAEANSSPAQRGAVTRAKNRLREAQKASLTTMKAGAGARGVLRPGRKTAPAKPSPAASGAANKRVPFSRPKAGNNIRPAKKLPGRGWRALDRAADNINAMGGHLKKARGIYNQMARTETRDALRSNFDREITRQSGGIMRVRAVVQRRQQRAFNVQNGRNPQIGARALFVYQQQLRQLGEPSNQRVTFRRKPMTPSQMKRAKAARNKVELARMSKALDLDMKAEQSAKKAANPKPKRKRKPRKKSD